MISKQELKNFLKLHKKFIKTTTGTITSLTVLIGAASGLGLTFGIKLSPEIATNCSDEKLSIKYLNQEPLDTKAYLIEKPDVSMNMEISIYKDGDTLTTYGTYRKWVCFPQIEISHPAETVANSLINFLIPQVVAQTTVPLMFQKELLIFKIKFFLHIIRKLSSKLEFILMELWKKPV